MSNRRATVAQADVTRTLKALQRAGLAVARVVIKADRVEIEAAQDNGELANVRVEKQREIVL